MIATIGMIAISMFLVLYCVMHAYSNFQVEVKVVGTGLPATYWGQIV